MPPGAAGTTMNQDGLDSASQIVTSATAMWMAGSEEALVSSSFFELLLLSLVFLACLGMSAFFSSAETALTSMSKIRVKRLFVEGEEQYKKLEPWLKDPNRFLVTILVGNNFVNVVASVIAANICERILVDYFSVSNAVALGSALAVAGTTFVLLVFGEIVPKTYAREHASRLSLLAVEPLEWMYRFLRPFIGLFLVLSSSIIRMLGGQAIKEVPLLTEEDIRTLIEVSEKEGVLEEEEREMIHSIIEFGDTLVKEIMTPRVDVQAIPANVTLDEAREEAIRGGHSRIPVYENNIDRIVGILYVKDLLRVMNGEHPFNLREIVRPALFVPKTKRVSDLLETFKKKKNHIAMVVDEYGLTAGLVTIEDVLEEIVGDIQDEYDQEPPEYETQPDGTIIADAKIDLDTLSDVLDIEFPDEDVETLGGFLSSQKGDVPGVGDEILFQNHRFTVLDANELRINRVKIARIEPESGESSPDHPVEMKC